MDLIQTKISLLGRLKNWDDDKSWREFFDTYWRIIYSAARQAGLDDAESQEVVQQTILSVAKEMQRFKYDPAAGTFKAWLKTITQRRIADQFRKRPKLETKLPAETSASGVTPLERIADPASSDRMDKTWDAEWKRALLERAIELVRNEVSARQFQIFDLLVLQEKSAAEVAAALDISRARVYLAKHRVSSLVAKAAKRLERAQTHE